MSNSERSYIMIKPDGVQRGLTGEIIKRFEQKGYKLVAMKMLLATREQMEGAWRAAARARARARARHCRIATDLHARARVCRRRPSACTRATTIACSILTAFALARPPIRPAEHYKDLNKKGFFAGLVSYMISGPVVCMVCV